MGSNEMTFGDSGTLMDFNCTAARTAGKIAVFTAFCALLLPRPSLALDESSKQLAYCAGVFAYAANYSLLIDNEGAAKVMILQQARATVTLFSMHYANGRVAGATVAEIGVETRRAKTYLDGAAERYADTVDDCVSTTTEFAAVQSKKGIIMWDQEFYELVEQLASQMRAALGLK